MRPFLLAVLAIPFALHATTTATTSCSAGSTTDTPCPGNANLTTGLSGPNYFVSSYAQATDSPLGNIAVLGEATASYTPGTGLPEPPLSATDQAVVDDVYYTSGPVRPGYIQISETIYSLHGLFTTTWSITDGPYSYGGCLPGTSNANGCTGSDKVPFELGVPFEVIATASDGVAVSPPENGYGADDQVTLTFSLFEQDRHTSVAFFPIPEPSALALSLFGLLAFALLQWSAFRAALWGRR